jgi:hypothetical protein
MSENHPFVVRIVTEETDSTGSISVLSWDTLVRINPFDERLNSNTFMRHLAQRDALKLFKLGTVYGPETKITVESVKFIDLW